MRLIALLACLPLVLALAACGTEHDATAPRTQRPVRVELDFFPNADHAALYAALDRGFFSQAGLDVIPQAPADPSEPLKLLASGQVDIAISYEPELLLARDRGEQLVSIGALVQRPLTSIIAVGRAHIASPAALAGKRIGTAGIPYQTAMLDTILQAAHVAPRTVPQTDVGFNLVPAMLSGKVDATIGGFWNYEGIQLAQLGRRPTVIPVDRAGVPTYDELVLVVRAQEARSEGRLLRAFMLALARGQRAVKADIHAAVADLTRASPGLDGRLQATSIKQTLPYTVPADPKLPYGWQDSGQWRAFADWMQSHGLIHTAASDSVAFTDEFLPGEGVPLTGSSIPDQSSGQ